MLRVWAEQPAVNSKTNATTPRISIGERVVALAVALLLITACTTARAADPTVGEGPALATQVLQVFDQKCAACHSPQAKKVKKFDYIKDLPKLATSKYCIAGNPAKSTVWTSIEEGEMPPDDSDISPLSDREKEIVKKWIAVGCPLLVSTPTVAAVPVPHVSLMQRIIRLVGKLHPLAAHFPIGLLMAGAMAEMLWLRTRQAWLTAAVRFCIVFGAVSAVGAAGLGWLNAYFHSSNALLTQHRWLGTAATIWTIPLAVMCERGARHPVRSGGSVQWTGRSRLIFQAVLFLAVILVGVAAHIGGAIVYGEDYFQL